MDEMKVSGGAMSFPAGLRVLVVDDDPICLKVLDKMLRDCKYHVTKTNRAEIALNLLRENRNEFDIIMSDVHMPDMDGLKLLELVGLEMDLPVIMMSADDSNDVVMKGVTHGACDYLIKPVRIEALKNIWQHVVRKKKNERKELEQSSSWDEGDRYQKQDDGISSPANEGSWKSSKRKSKDEDSVEKDDTATLKKPRVVWSVELHQQFVAAVNQLGIDKAVPKKILELMNVPGLTRENVASHLQKYRLYLKRLAEHQGGLNSSYISHDSGFSAMSSFSGFDLQAQALAAYSRLPPVSSSISMPFIDQRNLVSFENSNSQLGNVSKHMNLLHGIPTTMEPTQLAILNQSAQNVRNMNFQANVSSSHQGSALMKSAPQQSQGQLLNGRLDGFASRIQPPIVQPNDWQMQNPNVSFGSSSQHMSSGVNVVPPVLLNQSYISSQNDNTLAGKPIFSTGLDNNQRITMHNVNGVIVEDTPRVKAERIPKIVNPGTNLLSEHCGQEDLMCALLKPVRNRS